MSYELIKTGKVDNTNPYQYWMDKDEDVKNLPINIPNFSTAISIDSGNVYCFSKFEKKWKSFGNISSGGSGVKNAAELPAVVPEGLTAQPNVQSILDALSERPGGGEAVSLPKFGKPIIEYKQESDQEGAFSATFTAQKYPRLKNCKSLMIEIDGGSKDGGLWGITAGTSQLFYSGVSGEHSTLFYYSVINGKWHCETNTTMRGNHDHKGHWSNFNQIVTSTTSESYISPNYYVDYDKIIFENPIKNWMTAGTTITVWGR